MNRKKKAGSRDHGITTSRKEEVPREDRSPERPGSRSDGYRERPKRTTTWSGLEVQESYSRKDAPSDREPPGEYPFTRGIHPNMYRGRFWTRREVCGIGGPKDTNELIKYLQREGQTGVNVIFDIPTMTGLDADHPRVPHEIGVQGTSVSSFQDMVDLFAGIPIEELSVSLVVTSSAAPVILSMFLELAAKRGVDTSKLRGTVQNDPLHHRYCGYPAAFAPIGLALHTAVDIMEYTTRKVPGWHPINVNGYDFRESGINAPQEMAFALAQAEAYIQAALARGLPIDSFAPRFAFYMSAHIDILEEVAKLRAIRRMWARMMMEKYGAKNPDSMKFHFAVHTAGCALYPQQPMVNVVRIAYQALAATLAGAGSLHCCAYDEPFALPTRESHRLALRTQQVLAYETGVANTADPLGGSYYVESLTDRLEEEARQVLNTIVEQGGMVEAIDSGWIDREMDKAALQHQKEVESGERTIVGVNAFTISPTEDTQVVGEEAPASSKKEQIRRLVFLREGRDGGSVNTALRKLGERARRAREFSMKVRESLKGRSTPLAPIASPGHGEISDVNLIPAMRDAVRYGATLGEVLGVVREGFGEPYDPMGVLMNPFE
ncbi:MAG: methylmalonyl-CoA mutase [Nitrospirae bacterium]|nr:methylmalonyl-CoA mutase [Nitrospirota bacterium]